MSVQVTLPGDAGPVLTRLARDAIGSALGRGDEPADDDTAWLCDAGASFVTLTIAGQLRGCIGSLVAYRPLGRDVVENARAAAFDDPRFPPLRAGELKPLRIEVSVLSEPEPYPFTSREDALSRLRPGVDGVILRAGRHRATFLPQVWDELADPEQFIGHLLRKAGLPPDYWSDALVLQRYGVTAFTEAR